MHVLQNMHIYSSFPFFYLLSFIYPLLSSSHSSSVFCPMPFTHVIISHLQTPIYTNTIAAKYLQVCRIVVVTYSGGRKKLRLPYDSIIKKSQVSLIYMISRWNLVDICIGQWATCHDSHTWNFCFRIRLALEEGQSVGANANAHNSLKIHHRIMKLDMNCIHGWQ